MMACSMSAVWDEIWKDVSFPPLIYWYTEEFLYYLVKWSSEKGHELFLEPGAGSGRFSYYLSKQGREVVALDLSRNSILLLRRLKNLGKGVFHVVRADILHMPFRDFTFGVVYSEGVVEHFAEPHTVVKEMTRVVAKSGILILSVPNTFSFHTFARDMLARFVPTFWRHRLWAYGFEKSFSRSHVNLMLRRAGLRSIDVHGIGLLFGIVRYMPHQVHNFLYVLYVRLRETMLWKTLTEYVGFQIIAKGEKIDEIGE